MKSRDIVTKNEIPEDECGCCYLHDKAYKKLNDEILCPKCDSPLNSGGAGYDGYVVVGEQNGYHEEDSIGKYQLYSCNKCGEDYNNLYALMPIPIKWNANHDIFYTGGKYYLPEDTSNIDKKIDEKIYPQILQYLKRTSDGEKLESWMLMTWIKYSVEHVISEYLYEKGYKK